MENVFFDIGLIVIVAGIFGFIARSFKQPLIPAYILGGVILNPLSQFFFGYPIISDRHTIELLSEIGITFLLFIVGLELDIKKIKKVGNVAIFGGLIQMFILFLLSYFTALLLGFTQMQSVYMGIIIIFSSTMVVVKFLSDKHELNSLYGRIVIGILLLQDIIAIILLTILSNVNDFSFVNLGITFVKGGLIILFGIILSKLVIPRVFRIAARTQELLFVVSISFAFIFAFAFHSIGLSSSIGAFVAGVILGNLAYSFEIVAKVKSLRDFFVTIFFVSIGLNFNVNSDFSSLIIPILVFLIFTVMLKPFIVFVSTSLFKYKAQIGFFSGLSLGQVSEFALVVVVQGLLLNHVGDDFLTMVLILMILSTISTTYSIKYNSSIYSFFKKRLKIFKFFNISHKDDYSKLVVEKGHKFLLCGYDRIGQTILKRLNVTKKDYVVIDFNPDIAAHLLDKGISTIYGDVSDEEILEQVDYSSLKVVVSTIPSMRSNIHLLKYVKHENKNIVVMVTSYTVEEALKLYDHGADYVIIPHLLGGESMANLLNDFVVDNKLLDKTRRKHIEDLKIRKSDYHNIVGH